MLIKRVWLQSVGNREWQREGWYLFGILPLYVRDSSPRERRKSPERLFTLDIHTS